MNAATNPVTTIEPTGAKRLTKEEKAKAAEACLKHGGLVREIALKYVRPGFELEDLIQAGYLGLMNAVADWKEDGGSLFTTIAALRIRDVLKVLVWETSEERKRRAEVRQGEELPNIVPIDALCDSISMDASVDDGDSLHDLIGTDADQERGLEIRNALATLDEQDRELLFLSVDLTDPEIAEQVKLPRETVRNRRTRALAKLNSALNDVDSPLPAILQQAA